MELKLIEKLAGVMSRTAIETLEYHQGGTRIKLLRSTTGHGLPAQSAAEAGTAPTTATTTVPTASPASLHSVMAGMSGTFYGAPASGKTPFVKVGDSVQEGQVLAIIEAMKMLNQIEADASGRVARVALADGTAVTPTTVLFEIEPQGSRA